jgi:hypothetical protein
MSYEDPVAQRSMVLDRGRNEAYEKALLEVLTPESVVLDLGAGLGVLGLMAAQHGAKRVYLVEPATTLEAARAIARDNGLEERIETVSQAIESASLPEKADIILSVFTGNFLLEEDLLPSLFLARDRYLKDGGSLIPDMGRMFVMPVNMPAYHSEQIRCWEEPIAGVDHRVMRQYAVNQLYHGRFNDISHVPLAEAQMLKELDFNTAVSTDCDESVELSVSSAGDLHGFLGWFDMRLGESWYSTSPSATATHWAQIYLPIDPVLSVTPGDTLRFSLHRPEKGEWTWQLARGGKIFRHSTFLSRPLTADELRRRSDDYRPLLSEDGQIANWLLSHFDGGTSIASLAEMARTRYPGRFDSLSAALEFVRNLPDRFGD